MRCAQNNKVYLVPRASGSAGSLHSTYLYKPKKENRRRISEWCLLYWTWGVRRGKPSKVE